MGHYMMYLCISICVKIITITSKSVKKINNECHIDGMCIKAGGIRHTALSVLVIEIYGVHVKRVPKFKVYCIIIVLNVFNSN